MISLAGKSDCCGCGSCCNICPVGAIAMQSDKEGFLYPVVNGNACTGCNVCVRSCPVSDSGKSNCENSVGYWAINTDEKIRSASSSGGIFTLLAEKIIGRGGVVFGAAFSHDYRNVNHIAVDKKEDLYLLRGSKYLQSNIGDIYKDVRTYLENKKEVLFSGTPCQTEGLLAFLGKKYENLLCVDFICHGVPSPFVWNKYVEFVESAAHSRVTGVKFRDKRSGWKTYSVLFEFENNAEYCNSVNDDLFMRAFLNDICLRPSCYACKFRKLHRRSDITLADFWGVDRLMPEIDDDKGVSFVIIHTPEGKKILESSGGKIKSGKVDIDSAIKYNSAMLDSFAVPKNRILFFENLDTMEFSLLVKKFAVPSFYRRVRRKLGKIKKALLRK